MSGLAFNTVSLYYFWAVELDNRTASGHSQCMNFQILCETNDWRSSMASGEERGQEQKQEVKSQRLMGRGNDRI